MSPLLWSAWFGHLEALRKLINAGANNEARNRVSAAPNPTTCALQPPSAPHPTPRYVVYLLWRTVAATATTMVQFRCFMNVALSQNGS